MNGEHAEAPAFIFRDDAGRPYKVLYQHGKPWLYRWQLEQRPGRCPDGGEPQPVGYWVAVREIHDKDLPGYQIRRLSSDQAAEYESLHDQYLKFKTHAK